MSSSSVQLTSGALISILEQRNESLRPVVQILGIKMMNNNKIRAVIYDGSTIFQYCVLVSDDVENQLAQGLLDKFTVICLEEYDVTSLPMKEVPVILVKKLAIIKPGHQIGRKLNSVSENIEATKVHENDLNNNSKFESPIKSVNSPNVSPSVTIVRPLPTVSGKESEQFCPIKMLTPFFSGWRIRAYVAQKSDIRTFSNKRGQGKVFNFDVCDDSGEIQITCFNEECDRFYNTIQTGKFYKISGGTIKAANKQYSSLNNDYQMVLNRTSIVSHCDDEKLMAPRICYDFVNLKGIINKETNSAMDVIAIIHSVGDLEIVVSKKTGKEMRKRNVEIVDDSRTKVRVTFWNDQAENFHGQAQQVIALKSAIVADFKGKLLTVRDTTSITLDPDRPETLKLTNWYKNLDSFASFSELVSPDYDICPKGFISQVNIEHSCDHTRFFQLIATVLSYNNPSNHFYKSCGYESCTKKLQEYDGQYKCLKCDRIVNKFEWRMMINMKISDVSGSLWVTVFPKDIQQIFGLPTQQVVDWFINYPDRYNQLVSEKLRFQQFYFRISSRMQSFNSEMRFNNTVHSMEPLKPGKLYSFCNNWINILGNQST